MTSRPENIQALLDEIDAIVGRANEQLRDVPAEAMPQELALLEQIRGYLSQQGSALASPDRPTDGPPRSEPPTRTDTPGAVGGSGSTTSSTGIDTRQLEDIVRSALSLSPPTAPPTVSPAATPRELADTKESALARDIMTLHAGLLQPLRSDLENLRQERSQLARDIEQMQNQAQYQGSLARQQDNQKRTIETFVGALQDRLQRAISDQFGGLLQALESRLVNYFSSYFGDRPPQSVSGSPVVLHPAQRFEQVQRLQADADRLILELDSKLQTSLGAMLSNVHSYETSLAASVENIHRLSQQGEAIVRALVERSAQMLDAEAPGAQLTGEALEATIEADGDRGEVVDLIEVDLSREDASSGGAIAEAAIAAATPAAAAPKFVPPPTRISALTDLIESDSEAAIDRDDIADIDEELPFGEFVLADLAEAEPAEAQSAEAQSAEAGPTEVEPASEAPAAEDSIVEPFAESESTAEDVVEYSTEEEIVADIEEPIEEAPSEIEDVAPVSENHTSEIEDVALDIAEDSAINSAEGATEAPIEDAAAELVDLVEPSEEARGDAIPIAAAALAGAAAIDALNRHESPELAESELAEFEVAEPEPTDPDAPPETTSVEWAIEEENIESVSEPIEAEPAAIDEPVLPADDADDADAQEPIAATQTGLDSRWLDDSEDRNDDDREPPSEEIAFAAPASSSDNDDLMGEPIEFELEDELGLSVAPPPDPVGSPARTAEEIARELGQRSPNEELDILVRPTAIESGLAPFLNDFGDEEDATGDAIEIGEDEPLDAFSAMAPEVPLEDSDDISESGIAFPALDPAGRSVQLDDEFEIVEELDATDAARSGDLGVIPAGDFAMLADPWGEGAIAEDAAPTIIEASSQEESLELAEDALAGADDDDLANLVTQVLGDSEADDDDTTDFEIVEVVETGADPDGLSADPWGAASASVEAIGQTRPTQSAEEETESSFEFDPSAFGAPDADDSESDRLDDLVGDSGDSGDPLPGETIGLTGSGTPPGSLDAPWGEAIAEMATETSIEVEPDDSDEFGFGDAATDDLSLLSVAMTDDGGATDDADWDESDVWYDEEDPADSGASVPQEYSAAAFATTIEVDPAPADPSPDPSAPPQSPDVPANEDFPAADLAALEDGFPAEDFPAEDFPAEDLAAANLDEDDDLDDSEIFGMPVTGMPAGFELETTPEVEAIDPVPSEAPIADAAGVEFSGAIEPESPPPESPLQESQSQASDRASPPTVAKVADSAAPITAGERDLLADLDREADKIDARLDDGDLLSLDTAARDATSDAERSPLDCARPKTSEIGQNEDSDLNLFEPNVYMSSPSLPDPESLLPSGSSQADGNDLVNELLVELESESQVAPASETMSEVFDWFEDDASDDTQQSRSREAADDIDRALANASPDDRRVPKLDDLDFETSASDDESSSQIPPSRGGPPGTIPDERTASDPKAQGAEVSNPPTSAPNELLASQPMSTEDAASAPPELTNSFASEVLEEPQASTETGKLDAPSADTPAVDSQPASDTPDFPESPRPKARQKAALKRQFSELPALDEWEAVSVSDLPEPRSPELPSAEYSEPEPSEPEPSGVAPTAPTESDTPEIASDSIAPDDAPDITLPETPTAASEDLGEPALDWTVDLFPEEADLRPETETDDRVSIAPDALKIPNPDPEVEATIARLEDRISDSFPSIRLEEQPEARAEFAAPEADDADSALDLTALTQQERDAIARDNPFDDLATDAPPTSPEAVLESGADPTVPPTADEEEALFDAILDIVNGLYEPDAPDADRSSETPIEAELSARTGLEDLERDLEAAIVAAVGEIDPALALEDPSLQQTEDEDLDPAEMFAAIWETMPPTPTPSDPPNDRWYLALAVETDEISAILLDRHADRHYPLRWPHTSQPERLPCAVYLPPEATSPNDWQTGEAALDAADRHDLADPREPGILLHDFLDCLNAGISWRDDRDAFQPIVRWSARDRLALYEVRYALRLLLENVRTEARVELGGDPASGSLPELAGVCVSQRADSSAAYRFNLREAIVEAGLVSHPGQIIFADPIAASLRSIVTQASSTSSRDSTAPEDFPNSKLRHQAVHTPVRTLVVSGSADAHHFYFQDGPNDAARAHHFSYGNSAIELDTIASLLLADPTLSLAIGGDRPASACPAPASPKPGDPDLAARIYLRQWLQETPQRRSLRQTARDVIRAFQGDSARARVRWADISLEISRTRFETQVLVPKIAALNRELNHFFSLVGLTATSIDRVVIIGRARHWPAIATWLRQKCPNATLERADALPPAIGLARTLSERRISSSRDLPALDLDRQRYDDYFVVHELLRNLPQSATTASATQSLLERAGVPSAIAKRQIAALLDNRLPPGLIPNAPLDRWLDRDSLEHPVYQVLRDSPLFEPVTAPPTRSDIASNESGAPIRYQAKFQHVAWMVQYLYCLTISSAQNFQDPLCLTPISTEPRDRRPRSRRS
ncbi:MAG: hypothetical protein ACFB9N_05850 [Geitlerinemataceae cyanobacterium]